MQLLLVFLPAFAAGARFHAVLAALVEDSFAISASGGCVELKGENDAAVVTNLTDKAPLGTEVTVIDMVGSKLDQRLQVHFKYAIGYLSQISYTVFMGGFQ